MAKLSEAYFYKPHLNKLVYLLETNIGSCYYSSYPKDKRVKYVMEKGGNFSEKATDIPLTKVVHECGKSGQKDNFMPLKEALKKAFYLDA